MIQEIHSFKKEIDHIPVPHDKLDAIITKTVQEAGAGQRTGIRKKMGYVAGAAAVACGLLLGSAALSPAMASLVSKIPVIGSVFSQIGDSGLKSVSEQGLTAAVGATKVSGGDSLTINEVFYDGTRLSIGYSLETEKPLGEEYIIMRTDFTVNGTEAKFSARDKLTEVTPTYHTGILELDSPAKLPDQFELGLNLSTEDRVKKWDFAIPVSKQADNKLIPIGHKQQSGGVELTVSDLVVGPAGMRLAFSAVSEDQDSVDYLSVTAVDESGHELGSLSGGTGSKFRDGKYYSTGTQLFDRPPAGTKTLTFTPHEASGRVKFDSFTVTLP
ncbi:hypothetical protein J2Z22_004316 [Paenibacillus forsythiae]|uniref:DUF4179 domain-containing protein n=1 Tax=Paenibacillus forsythiae TaxID=365616 RepID=A0ABU3HD36_9BACL|nr:DUF4179 domain-containing protein [Paenibacillus forsythiae]MDT3428723.1 hypothetical protein [Paenibacillus forsythiae]